MQTELTTPPTFYIIRRSPPGAGFFSNFLHVLGHIVTADEKGLIPIVDMLNYTTLYNETFPVNGTYNAWEYYFKPFNDFTLGDAYSNNHILSTFEYQFDKVQYNNEHYTNQLPSKQTIELLNPYLNKYVIPQPYIMDIVNYWYSEFKNYNKVLGIHIRGTDMNYTPGHPKQPSIQELLLKTQSIIDEYSVDGIFVCGDEQESINLFKDTFKDRIIETQAFRATQKTHIGIHTQYNSTPIRENHHFLLGLEVLVDMLLLSKCNLLLCGLSNVTYVANLFNNHQYEKVFLL